MRKPDFELIMLELGRIEQAGQAEPGAGHNDAHLRCLSKKARVK
jgi:hypothetical protein